MSKILRKSTYNKVAYGSENYIDLSGLTEVNAENGRKGEIGICDSDGSRRVCLSKNIFSQLEEPDAVKVLMNDKMIAFRAVPLGTKGAYTLGKGAVIYSTTLADTITANVSDVEFKENATTRFGHIEAVQSDENGFATVILNYN
ncbi:MAG: hypothetical protein PUA84_07440 [Oscillospiraceae bacterium]|nr:hypothetical protein [Oscillospiraceae bacterium]